MAVDVGSATGYLDLDISGFLKNLKTAQSEADSTSKSMAAKIGSNLEGAGKKISTVGSTLTKTVTAPILGISTAVVKLTSDFESAMSKVKAISGATGDDFERLKEKAQEMGAKTKFSATESAEAFTYMAMAGWKTEDMLQGIEGIMSLAAADGLDLATTSDIVTDALTAFGLSAKDSGHFADVLAKASSAANTNVSMLGESFKYVAPVAGSLGYSAEDTAIALGLMANSGIKGSQAGTALRGAITRLIKPSDAAAAAMEKYGLSLTNSDGSMKSLSEVMVMLREKMGDLTEAEQAEAAALIFGQEAMSGMLSIINASEKDFEGLIKQIYNADGAAQQMADTMLDNLSGQITILKSSIEGLALQFGELLLPYVKQAVSWFQNLVQKFQELSPEQKEQIVKWGAIAAAIGPTLIVVGKVVTGAGKLFTAFSKLSGGFKAVAAGGKAGAGMLSKLGGACAGVTGPMIAIVAVIAVLVAAFVNLWKNNEDFRNKITEIWNQIKETFQKLTQGIVDRLNALGFEFEDITEVIKAVWEGFCNFLAPVFEGVFQFIADTFDTVVNVILNIFDFFVALFKGDWEGCWNAIKGFFESIWNGLKDWFLNILNVLKGVLDVVLGWFGTSWSNCWNSIKSFFENIWNGIVSWFQNTLNSISTFFSNIWNGIVSFFTTTWETIKSVIQVGIDFIVSLIVFAFELITIPFRFIWENCKETIISVWEAIKSKVKSAIDAVSNVITTVFNAIKNFVTPIWNSIKTTITTVWNTIKNTITTVLNTIKNIISTAWNNIKSTATSIWNGIKTTISNVWNSIKNTASTVWNAVKTAISTPINAAKETISSVVNSIKSIISTGFNAAKNTVTGIFDSIKSKIDSIMNSVKSIVSGAIAKVKGAFNFSWSLPKLKLPHISVTGGKAPYGIGGKGSLPKFSIEWYKKAMSGGMILNSATIFGIDPLSGKLLGGGEAGSETVVGTASLLKMIRQSVADAIIPIANAAYQMARTSVELGYVAKEGFVRQVQTQEEYNRRRRDNPNGDTFIFNSPKAIDEVEAARQMRKTKREMAEGF